MALRRCLRRRPTEAPAAHTYGRAAACRASSHAAPYSRIALRCCVVVAFQASGSCRGTFPHLSQCRELVARMTGGAPSYLSQRRDMRDRSRFPIACPLVLVHFICHDMSYSQRCGQPCVTNSGRCMLRHRADILASTSAALGGGLLCVGRLRKRKSSWVVWSFLDVCVLGPLRSGEAPSEGSAERLGSPP